MIVTTKKLFTPVVMTVTFESADEVSLFKAVAMNLDDVRARPIVGVDRSKDAANLFNQIWHDINHC